ncbi:unnamed protein product [Soboliphyme baturini]|uniref:sphinganine-1-phosphate aldolase n=1 Tax=Soboliphyme baturini TaxID=241478 RepID=A0A3P8FL38_9BILA|nr:unnamed protein product [Soboliphyme baturini]
MVGSAPNFPHGIADSLERISDLGAKYNIPVHVDCCLGGFLLPFMEKAGFEMDEMFDFRLRGVTSISCDTHKYGFAPKGTSVLIYRHEKLLHHQFFCQPDWMGGIYASSTLAGSRSGANIAACWATMMHFGIEGYVETTKKIIDTTRMIEKRLRAIQGIHVIGSPKLSVLAFTSSLFNIYALSSRMSKRGWSLTILQSPPAVHLCVTMNHTRANVAEEFLSDIEQVATELVEKPDNTVEGTLSLAAYLCPCLLKILRDE